MKGINSLFQKHISKEVNKEAKQRPRNYFMPERNDLLVHRYYFYVHYRNFRFDKCLNILQTEIYITEQTITNVLTVCSEILDDVFKRKPSIKELEKKFPHFHWPIKE